MGECVENLWMPHSPQKCYKHLKSFTVLDCSS
jgi:hypothetical protein